MNGKKMDNLLQIKLAFTLLYFALRIGRKYISNLLNLKDFLFDFETCTK